MIKKISMILILFFLTTSIFAKQISVCFNMSQMGGEELSLAINRCLNSGYRIVAITPISSCNDSGASFSSGGRTTSVLVIFEDTKLEKK